jgi:hypothetical protein
MKSAISLLVFLFSATAMAAAGFPVPSTVEFLGNNPSNEGFRKIQLGTQLVQKKTQLMKAKYDFAKQGGAVGAIILQDVDGKDAVLPTKAIIRQVILDIQTGITSGGLATVALGANTTTDLLAATAKASLGAGLVAGIPVGTAATAVKTTAQRNITATVGTAALTAGKFTAFIEYYLSE